MTVKTETKALTKEKVLRTHACVIDTHKKSLEKNSHYFMTFLPGVEFDKNGNNEVQAICPHCSNILGVYPDAINGGENDSTIKCNSCEIEYRADDYKFVADKEGRGGYYQKRKTQWVNQIEFFLSNGEILHIRPYITTSFVRYSEKAEKYVVAKQTHIFKMAFNLRTGLSYFLGCVDGAGKPFEVYDTYGVANFKRNKGNYPIILKYQAEKYDVLKNVFPEISFMVKDVIKETPFFLNADGLENVKSFFDLSVWNRLKQVDSKRGEFYEILAKHFALPIPTSTGCNEFLSKNSTYIAKLLKKEREGLFEAYVNNISSQTKSGKALKKQFYKNPMNIRYNHQLYRLGLKDANYRFTFFDTLNKVALLGFNSSDDQLGFQNNYFELISFFLEVLSFSGDKKVNSLIKQLGSLIKSFEVLYNIEQGNLSNLKTPINFDNFVMGSFKIQNYRGTKMLEKFSMFSETMSLYYRLKDSIEEFDEASKTEFQRLIETSFLGKNFHEIHENLSGISKAINSFKDNMPIDYSEDDRRYEGVFGDYEFFLPEKVVDFTEFGREFRNCVGSYTRTVIKKDRLIVIARHKDTKKLKLCIEISGEKSAYTNEGKRCSFQYKSFCNNRPKEADLPSLIEWYETLGIDNRHCYDAYWEDKATKDDSLVRDLDDEDLPF